MPVRLRVYNVFKGWLETHWRDDTDREALGLIQPFAEQKLAAALPSAGRRLLELAERVSSEGSLVPRHVSSMGKTNTSIAQYVPADTPHPAPNITKSQLNALVNWKNGGNSPSILDFDPLEVARQLTIKQMNIFCAILPEELLASQWMKNSGVDAPNVKAMSAFSTDLSNLVAETVLQYMGSLSNSSRKAANLAGFYKGIQSAGAAVFWRLDGLETSYDTIFGATWGMLGAALLIAAPVIWMRIKDTTDVEEDLRGTDETVEDVIAPGKLAEEEKRAAVV
ncbi:hypothetical protein BN1723_013268, partial [Verticillium longisporum]